MLSVDKALKIKLDRIINIFEQVSFEKYDELKHSVREHMMWIENCWTYLHCLYPFKIPIGINKTFLL